MSNALIIFVKAPQLGKVKTRIAKDVGDEMALDIYKKLLTHTRKTVESVDVNRYLYYAFEIRENDDWSDQHFYKKLQVEGNLGDRMQSAFSEVLDNHEKCVIIGSDCGELVEADIEKAFAHLEEVDVVIGPAKDGGYYLLGMKRSHQEIFDNMPWSSEFLLEKTQAACKQKGLSYLLLEEKSDVDYYDDWLQVKERIRG